MGVLFVAFGLAFFVGFGIALAFRDEIIEAFKNLFEINGDNHEDRNKDD